MEIKLLAAKFLKIKSKLFCSFSSIDVCRILEFLETIESTKLIFFSAEIESVLAKQTKRSGILVSFKTFCQWQFLLPPSKGYLKTHFEFSFGINVNFIYSNSP